MITGGGAQWQEDDTTWRVRFDFEDSFDCGGASALPQTGFANRVFELSQDVRLTIRLRGRIESWRAGADAIRVEVDGQMIEAGSPGGGAPCEMVNVEAQQELVLTAGIHFIVIRADWDEFSHHGAYWAIDFIWSPI